MRRVRYYEYGGPEVLRVEEADVPVPGTGQVLIRAEVIGASFIDTVMRSGTGVFGRQPLPGSPHGDVVGTVERVGADVDGVTVGDRVGAFVVADAYADYALADAEWLVRIPDGIDHGVASTLSMPAPVAIGALRAGRLEKGDTVLVHSAAGGIGQLAVQLAKAEGAGTVIATAGSTQKLALARSYGADSVVSYADPSWADQVRAIAPDGVDLILDSVGGRVTADGLGLLAPLGRAVLYGVGSNEFPVLPGDRVVGAGMPTVTGFSFLGWRAARPDAAHAEAADLIAYATAGRLRVAVQETVPLADAVEAHRILEDRSRVGRVLLMP